MSHSDSTPSVASRLASVTNALTRYASRAAGASQSAAVWHTLIELETESPRRVGDLAQAVRVTQPAMTGIVSRLEETGWVERVQDSSDGRARLIAGTPAGFDALDAWRQRVDAVLAPLFDDLDDADTAALTRAVEVIETRLRRARDAATPPRED